MNVYYTATVNSVTLPLMGCEYTEEMFGTGDFVLVVKNDKGLKPQTNYDTCIGAAGVSGQGVDVVIKRKGVTKFTGVCDNVTIGNRRIRISGKGEAIKLAWDSCTMWMEYLDAAANDIMGFLLSGTQITLGSSDYTSNINVGYQEGENKYRALYGLVKNYLGGECYVSGGEFFAKTAMGTDKSSTVTLEHGVNMINLTRDIDSFDLFNWVKLKGVGEGTFELTSGPAQDGTSQLAYGTRKLMYDAKRVLNQSELDAIKTNLLANHKDPTDKLEKVMFLDEGDYGLGIGDTVTVTNARLGVSGGYRIYEMRHVWDTNGEIVTATLSNNSRSVAKEIANISYKLDILNFYPQGNPLWIPIELPFTSLDVSQPISHEFVIPDTGDWNVNINDGEISVFSDRYRIWSKGAASGPASASLAHTYWIVGMDGDDLGHKHLVLNYSGSGSGGTSKNYETNGLDDYWLNTDHTNDLNTAYPTVESYSSIKIGISALTPVPAGYESIDGWFVYASVHNRTGLSRTYSFQLYNVTQGHELTKNINFNINEGGTIYTQARYEHGSGSNKIAINDQIEFRMYHPDDDPGSETHTGAHLMIVAFPIMNHTHDPEPGIYEFTGVWPVDVEVEVNGTKVADKNSYAGLAGGSKFTVRNIDILSELQTGANKILLKSTGTNSKGTLSMSGGARIFVRSKG